MISFKMERFKYFNSLVNNRNRILFRFPIYKKTFISEMNSNAIRSYITVTKQNIIYNHKYCRQKSSTIDGNIQILKIKPTRDKLRKFKFLKTNVTQVTDTSSSQKQQSVKLVTGSNLPQFMNECMSSMKQNSEPQTLQLNEEPLIFIPETNELQKEYDVVTHNDFGIQKSLNQSLKCYINACISENLTERAYAVLMSIRQSNKYRTHKFLLNDAELYGDLMAKYSMLCNWSRVSNIYDILIAENIPLTPQVYMTIMDCLGRMKDSQINSALIRKYIKTADKQGISLNDIMDKSTFIFDQRATVLRAIRRVNLSFTPEYTPPQLTYSNKLLESLNDGILSIDVKPEQLLELDEEFKISKSKQGFSASKLTQLTEEQIKNEIDGHITVKNVTVSKNVTEKMQYHRDLLNNLTNQWRIDIANAIRKKLSILQHQMKIKSTKYMNIYPYMRLLTPEQYTEILLDELLNHAQGCDLYSPTVVKIYGDLGLKVMHKYQMKLREQNGVNQKIRHIYETYREILCSGKCPDNPRQLWQRIIHHTRQTGPCVYQHNVAWPWSVRCDVGRTLFKILLENIKIDANLLDQRSNQVNYAPVVYSLFRKRDLLSREEVRPHPVLYQIVTEAKLDTFKFKTNEVPMTCPPIPWTSSESGGYLHSQTILLRLPPQFSHQNELMRRAPPEQLYPPLDACNQLGSIPWRVNTRILDLAIKIINLGGDEKLDVPLAPDSMVTDEHLKYRGLSRAKFDEMRNVKDEKYQQLQNELLSIYTDTLYKLSLANHFRDRPFWLPTNLDFRGRSYPVPPHLTHLSADLTRSMLCFNQKQPLGEHGLDWLKLHCINLTGMKKRDSIQDRLAYANEIIDDIIDSADKPLDGRQWWLKSDDPWQTLATCFEIADAIRSPNPSEYLSGFPVHQDGSCNGLQHYAALGRDFDGATSVNLAPSKVPQDVYATIANRVEELRQLDAANDVQVAIKLDGLIKRKTVKQTVMTTVYGVTAYGARLQIRKQLKNIGFSPEMLGEASTYLTTKTFYSLSEMFTSAREIQNWLTAAARYISTERSQHVEWTSPLGLPVIQPYTRENKLLSNVTVQTIPKQMGVNRVKEKNAFPPNFIHSLDSCHMMLTALNCERAGVSYVSVHDCFWTHPCTVPIMNRICREQFILLHSQPILEDLAESFYQKYEIDYKLKNADKIAIAESKLKKDKRKKVSTTTDLTNVPKSEHIFMRLPKKGNFDLNSVLDSTYFFS